MARFVPKTAKPKICAACGARAQRIGARYCLTCGKSMKEGYRPLDTIRASYGLQGKHFQFGNIEEEEPKDLFEQNKNNVSQTAWACVVYSMVPYLGILFIPFALVISGAGWVVAYRQPQLGGRRLAVACIGLTFLMLGVQICLWWLLYIIPTMDLR